MLMNHNKIEVLLVEDNPAEIRLIDEVFNTFQITNKLIHVSDGNEAINYLYKKGKYKNCQNPSLILLGLRLPKMDGRELLKVIKKDNNLKVIPVIMLIDSSYEKDINESYRNGASAVIIKPCDYDGYGELIHSLEDFWINKTQLPKLKSSKWKKIILISQLNIETLTYFRA